MSLIFFKVYITKEKYLYKSLSHALYLVIVTPVSIDTSPLSLNADIA